MTKQSETRDLVLDLIDEMEVGQAIPSERQLSADLGVSRLTVRAALDDLAREGYLIRRRGAGTFVSEPKIAQELTMTSFTDDMRRRGMRAASRTLELKVSPAGARPGPHREGSRRALVLRASARAVRDLHRRRDADDRAHGDGRGGVGGARRPATLPGLSVRAGDAVGRGRDRRVHRVRVPGRSLPARDRSVEPPAPRSWFDTPEQRRSSGVASLPRRWLRPNCLFARRGSRGHGWLGTGVCAVDDAQVYS